MLVGGGAVTIPCIVSRDTKCSAGNGDGDSAAPIAHAHSLRIFLFTLLSLFEGKKI